MKKLTDDQKATIRSAALAAGRDVDEVALDRVDAKNFDILVAHLKVMASMRDDATKKETAQPREPHAAECLCWECWQKKYPFQWEGDEKR